MYYFSVRAGLTTMSQFVPRYFLSVTTRDRELVSVLEVRITPGDLNPNLWLRSPSLYQLYHGLGWLVTFERNDGICISDINRDRIPQLCDRYWNNFLSHCCFSIIYMYIRAVYSNSLWYLVSEVKVNSFHIWICSNT